jgi:rRNA-processing protein FCF1
MQIVDDCPWKRVLEIWSDALAGLTDAAIVAVATTNRYDAVATFDRKLSNRLESFGLAAYW